MVSHRRTWAVQTQGIWMLTALVVLAFLDMLTLEFYFVISFIGLLAVSLLFAPSQTRPRWWTHLRLIRFAGLLVFSYLVYLRVVDVIGPI